ncbi:unnamed protein product [Zymoseptoria tritici ST99CH_3D1]|uniref:GRF-type domain-containing protein n=1 Tax=Zymoseptoria tritici (strain CBS 115943 / IPO323) TaxID=336722 RepID=F9WWR5_ZYMTI|nr:uncharacterized protein MYCGRDRAFT_107437 [Zymoseptoria tritici IPO323]EGP92149.1 hypothetical protein MYCGRDRAFT_107437 [Zymoseptoria tritici IPO323]SMR44843.1 unnamed protein product [Zymoseptoria tritici ST99CH_3D1]
MQRGRFTSSNRGGEWAGRGKSRGRGRGRGGFGKSTQPKGLFENGSWLCNCTPRLPAVRFQVKKEGANKGRFFYTCQETEPKRCDFFLWNEDAQPREAAAVLSNSRNEPVRDTAGAQQEGWAAGRGVEAKRHVVVREDSPTPTPSPSPVRTGGKRTSHQANLDISDDDWDLDGKEEAELARVADSLETPHKAVKTGVYATPGTTGRTSRTLPWLTESTASMSTPSSSAQKSLGEYFGTPSKPPTQSLRQASSSTIGHHSSMDIERGTQAKILPLERPHFNHEPTQAPSLHTTASPSTTPFLTTQVLPLLSSLPADKISAIHDILANHDLRYQGVIKGREIARAALQGKERRIAELEERVVGLEGEREVLRGIVAEFRRGASGGGESVDDEL